MKAALATRWIKNWCQIGGSVDSAQACWPQLLAAYEAPTRHYHTLTHLAECFAWLDRLVSEDTPDYAWLAMAIWLHDVVYDPHRADNEQQSAMLAQAWLTPAIPQPEGIRLVGDLILATATHQGEAPLTRLLLDIDLSILCAESDRFHAYEQQIRQEYQHIPLAAFAKGRVAVLQHFAARPSLYHHPALQARQAIADRNLQQSIQYWLAQLTAGQ